MDTPQEHHAEHVKFHKEVVSQVAGSEVDSHSESQEEVTAHKGPGAGGTEERTVDVMRQDNGPEAVLYDQIFLDLSGNT